MPLRGILTDTVPGSLAETQAVNPIIPRHSTHTMKPAPDLNVPLANSTGHRHSESVE